MSTTVGKRSDKAQAAVTAATKGRNLLGGTEAMRKAGETYLPKFSLEQDDDYSARLNQSWLFNGYKKTCEDMVGMLFKSPVELVDAPKDFEGWASNINMMGDDLSTFSSEVMKDAIRAGMSFILVDAPRIQEGTSLAAQRAQNIRPYFVHVKIEDILDWRTTTINNIQVLTHLRIQEVVEEVDPADEFGTRYRHRVRVMDLIDGRVQVRIFQSSRTTETRTDTTRYDLVDEPYLTGLEAITVVPVYSDRKGFWKADPMLSDLADVNIAHWQSQSDQRNILHFYRVPILHATGRDDDEALVIKAGTAVQSSEPDATLSWVEGGDASINAGRQDLKDLEFQMQVLGLQLLVTSTNETATGAALDAGKETTRLGLMADNLKDALETAFGWAGEYANAGETKMTVKVNKEFGVSMLSAQEVTALLQAVNTGNMSRATFLEELKRRSFIREDLDTDAELEAIEEEAPDLSAQEPQAFGEQEAV